MDRAVPAAASEPFPLLICVLGDFRVLRAGTPVPLRAGGKMAAILAGLARRDRFHASREALLELLWPGSQVECATQSLNTLVHTLRRQLGEALRGDPPVVRVDGGYRLNVGAGVMVDSVHFDALTDHGERRMRAGDVAAAIGLYQRAVDVYQGDLCDGGDLRGLIERERLRSRYLSLLARLLRHGDVAIVCGPDPYTVADDPATPPQVVIHPGQRCTTPAGEDLVEAMEWLGVRTWGNSPRGSVTMLTGTYELRSEISQRLLGALPALLVMPGDAWDSPLISLLGAEIVKDEPGQEAVLDRLLDLLLIAVLRAWFSRPEAEAPAWYRAHGDPVVGLALRVLHHNPARPWTVARLAAEAGVSRAALARRFTELVGEPPMSYLTGWRLALAADLLREPDATIGTVPHQVGYSNAFALSTAFKRVRGVSPRQHRVGVSDA